MMPSAILLVARKTSIRLTGIAFIGINLFDGLLGMFAKHGAVIQIVGIVNRGLCNGRGQDKPMIDVNGSMFFQAIMRGIVFDGPV
jgi:hypothetical protein